MVVNLEARQRISDESPLVGGFVLRNGLRRRQFVGRVRVVIEIILLTLVIANAEINPLRIVEIRGVNQRIGCRQFAVDGNGCVVGQLSDGHVLVLHRRSRKHQVGIDTRFYGLALAIPFRVTIFINIGDIQARTISNRDGLSADFHLADVLIHFLCREVGRRQVACVVADEETAAVFLRSALDGVVPSVVVGDGRSACTFVARDDNIVKFIRLLNEFPSRAVVSTLRTFRVVEQGRGRAARIAVETGVGRALLVAENRVLVVREAHEVEVGSGGSRARVPRVASRSVVQEKEVRRARAVGHRRRRIVRPSQVFSVEVGFLKAEQRRAFAVSSVGTENVELRRGRRARGNAGSGSHGIVAVCIRVVKCIDFAVSRNDRHRVGIDNFPLCILLLRFVGVDVRTNTRSILVRTEATSRRLDVFLTISRVDDLPGRSNLVTRVPRGPSAGSAAERLARSGFREGVVVAVFRNREGRSDLS